MNSNLNWHTPSLDEIFELSNDLHDSTCFTNDCSLSNLILLQKKYDIKIALNDGVLFRYFNGSLTRNGYFRNEWSANCSV